MQSNSCANPKSCPERLPVLVARPLFAFDAVDGQAQTFRGGPAALGFGSAASQIGFRDEPVGG
jgi:hypothetical protein